MTRQPDSVLVVSPKAEAIARPLEIALSRYAVAVRMSASGMEGFEIISRESPCMVIVDADLPDLPGMSFASIIKDMENGGKTCVYLYNIKGPLLFNTKADAYYFEMDEVSSKALLSQVEDFFIRRYLRASQDEAFLRWKIKQYERLPKLIDKSTFRISGIFSPRNELSGDCYDYWIDENDSGVYGFLFDCTGHDVESASQVGAVRVVMKKNIEPYQYHVVPSLAEAFREANNNIFALIDEDPAPVAALAFHIDFASNTLCYCLAGMPGFFLRRVGKQTFEAILQQNFPLGYEENTEYNDDSLSLDGVDELVFSSDGFSELVFHHHEVQEARIAKHDDVSAVIVSLKSNGKRETMSQDHFGKEE